MEEHKQVDLREVARVKVAAKDPMLVGTLLEIRETTEVGDSVHMETNVSTPDGLLTNMMLLQEVPLDYHLISREQWCTALLVECTRKMGQNLLDHVPSGFERCYLEAVDGCIHVDCEHSHLKICAKYDIFDYTCVYRGKVMSVYDYEYEEFFDFARDKPIHAEWGRIVSAQGAKMSFGVYVLSCSFPLHQDTLLSVVKDTRVDIHATTQGVLPVVYYLLREYSDGVDVLRALLSRHDVDFSCHYIKQWIQNICLAAPKPVFYFRHFLRPPVTLDQFISVLMLVPAIHWITDDYDLVFAVIQCCEDAPIPQCLKDKILKTNLTHPRNWSDRFKAMTDKGIDVTGMMGSIPTEVCISVLSDRWRAWATPHVSEWTPACQERLRSIVCYMPDEFFDFLEWNARDLEVMERVSLDKWMYTIRCKTPEEALEISRAYDPDARMTLLYSVTDQSQITSAHLRDIFEHRHKGKKVSWHYASYTALEHATDFEPREFFLAMHNLPEDLLTWILCMNVVRVKTFKRPLSEKAWASIVARKAVYIQYVPLELRTYDLCSVALRHCKWTSNTDGHLRNVWTYIQFTSELLEAFPPETICELKIIPKELRTDGMLETLAKDDVGSFWKTFNSRSYRAIAERFAIDYLRINPSHINKFPDPTEAMMIECVASKPKLIRAFFCPSNKVVMAALQVNGFAIKHVEDPTEEQCILAVQTTPLALQFVKDQTPKIVMTALAGSGKAAKFITIPKTEDMKTQACEKWAEAYSLFK